MQFPAQGSTSQLKGAAPNSRKDFPAQGRSSHFKSAISSSRKNFPLQIRTSQLKGAAPSSRKNLPAQRSNSHPGSVTPRSHRVFHTSAPPLALCVKFSSVLNVSLSGTEGHSWTQPPVFFPGKSPGNAELGFALQSQHFPTTTAFISYTTPQLKALTPSIIWDGIGQFPTHTNGTDDSCESKCRNQHIPQC